MNQALRTMHTETVRISPAAQEAVTEFRGEFFFLSNFYYAPITYMGQRYANNEAAFQAQKTRNPNKRKDFTIQNLQHPGDAKRLGRHLQLREDWEEIKLEQMYNICMARFGSVKNFVALVKNGSFLVRITDMTILIEKEFIYGSSKRPNPTDYYRKQHYQCG